MGAEDTPKRGFFSTRTTFKNRSTIFTLGSRDTVLTTELEDPIIIVPHAQKTEKRVSMSNSVSPSIPEAGWATRFEFGTSKQMGGVWCDN